MNVHNTLPKTQNNINYNKLLVSTISPKMRRVENTQDCYISTKFFNSQTPLDLNAETASPSFCGWFSRDNQLSHDEKPFKRKIFAPLLVHKKEKMFINTGNPCKVLDILKSKYFSYDRDYSYEVLTSKNKKTLVNIQVELLNDILNSRNCINIFNIKDFDYILKLKDRAFLQACLEYGIAPSEIKEEKIDILKYLNQLTIEDDRKKYPVLYSSDIENLNEDNLKFFEKIYNYRRITHRLCDNSEERVAFLNNPQNADVLINYFIKNNCGLAVSLNSKIVQSEVFEDWMKVLELLPDIIKRDTEEINNIAFASYYYSEFELSASEETYNPKIVAKVISLSEDLGIKPHINCLLDVELSAKILETCNKGLEDDAVFMLKTGCLMSSNVKQLLEKIQQKRKLEDSDYFVFECAIKSGVENLVLDVIENKPNIASVIAKYQKTNRALNLRQYFTNKAVVEFFRREKDFSDEEFKIIDKLFETAPVNVRLDSLLVLSKIGYLNEKIFQTNYPIEKIMRFSSTTVDLNVIKKVFDLNIAGLNLDKYEFVNVAEPEVAFRRLDCLNEISKKSPQYVSKFIKEPENFEDKYAFLQKALSCNMDESLILKGFEFGCDGSGVEKLQYIMETDPQILDYAVYKDKKELDLLQSYAREKVATRYPYDVIDLALKGRYSVDNLPDIVELKAALSRESDIFANVVISKILQYSLKNRERLKRKSIRDLKNVGINGVENIIKKTRLGKEIIEQGGVNGIIATILSEKLAAQKPIKPLNPKAQGELFNNLSYNNLKNAFKDFDACDYENQIPFKLKYTRNEFISDLNEICDKYAKEDVDKVQEFFGFSFNLSDDFARPNYTIPFEFTEKQKQLCEELNKTIEKFLYENKVMISDNPKMEKLLNSIVSFLPEFMSVIGKKQHDTHNYTVDVHTLKVLQECVNNPEYEKLPAKEQAILNVAVLLHDLGKAEGVKDEGHYVLSAIHAKTIFKKFKINLEMQERIYNLVENHHWLGNLATGSFTADRVACVFRNPMDYKLAKIFAKADLMGVSDEFYSSCNRALSGENLKDVEKILNSIYSTNAVLFTNKILSKANIKKLNGVKVIDLVNNSENLSEIFGQGVKKREDLRFLVHMMEPEMVNFVGMKVLSEIGNDTNLSTSFVGYKNNPTYYGLKYGVIVDSSHFNILVLSKHNLSSGTLKGKYSMMKILNPYDEVYSVLRKNSVELLKHELGVDDDEYAEIYKQISKYRNKSQIKDVKVGSRVFKKEDIIDAISVFENSFLNTSNHNEVVVYNPKLSAFVAMVNKYSEVPQCMKDVAKKYDLPIVILGENKKV